jgi:ABC-type dipeptide/oligopeptide/nickel transport system permease component
MAMIDAGARVADRLLADGAGAGRLRRALSGLQEHPGSRSRVEDIEAERVRLGLDRPFWCAGATGSVNAFQGEFGDSCILRLDINQLLGDKFWLSLGICLASLFWPI